ncbi:MAG TPA: hypothetical protein ENJ09_09250 [Planctomycetes bacterium]|nr:hypothetical protein [Planctomycetota bacterium]
MRGLGIGGLLGLAAASLAVLAPASLAQGGPPPKRSWTGVVQRMESAAEQLTRARRLKTLRFGLEPAERRRATDRAVEAYRAVRLYFPEARGACAEASFRAAELLAADGRTGAALEEYELAEEFGERTEFRARARLEIGRIHRRAGELREALDRFHAVATDPASPARRRGEAWLEAGDVWDALDKTEEAERAWWTATRTSTDARDRVAAFERIGRAHIARGDLEGAAGVLASCREALSEEAALETETGERVRRLLASMRLPRELEAAIERRAREQVSKRTP